MKKILFTICITSLLLSGFLVVGEAKADYKDELNQQLAATVGEQGADFGQARDPRLVAAYVIQILLGTLGTVFVVYIFYAGFLIMASGGEEEKVGRGKTIIRYAILGVVITMAAFGIAKTVERYLKAVTGPPGGPGGSGFWYAGVEYEQDEDQSQYFTDDPLGENTQIGGGSIKGEEWTD